MSRGAGINLSRIDEEDRKELVSLFSELFSYCHLKFRGTNHYGDTAYCVNAEDLVLDAI